MFSIYKVFAILCCCMIAACHEAEVQKLRMPSPNLFRYQHSSTIAIDSNDLRKLHNGELFSDSSAWGGVAALDSALHTRKYILYSWHGHHHHLTLFTVLVEAMGDALEIKLVGTDSSGVIRFTTNVANMGGESGAYDYESRAIRKAPDTLVETSVRKFYEGYLMPADWKGPNADTLIARHVITREGSIETTLTDSILHSRAFLDSTDWSYR